MILCEVKVMVGLCIWKVFISAYKSENLQQRLHIDYVDGETTLQIRI